MVLKVVEVLPDSPDLSQELLVVAGNVLLLLGTASTNCVAFKL